MLTSIDVTFIFNFLLIGKFRRRRVIQFCKYSPNSGRFCYVLSQLVADFFLLFIHNSCFDDLD